MHKSWKLLLVAGVLSALSFSLVVAQPRDGRGAGGRGGRMRGEGMRRYPQMQLGRFLMGVGLLEKNGKNKLSASQAKKIVAAISPWRKKSSMTTSQASALNQKLTAVLTAAQKKELQGLRPQRGGDGRGQRDGERRGRRRDGGPDGRRNPPSDAERRQMRDRMEKMRKFLVTYNPFYPPTKYAQFKQLPERMQQGVKRRFAAQEALLSQLAKKAAKV